MLDKQRVLRPAESVRTMHDESGDVLLDIKQGICYGLNAMGTRIWELLERGKSPEAIVLELATQFEMPAQEIRDDLADFLSTLQSKGLLCESHHTAGKSNAEPPGWRSLKGLLRSWFATTS